MDSLLEKKLELCSRIDQVVRFIKERRRGDVLRKAAGRLNGTCQELIPLAKAAQNARLQKLDALDRRLVEKGGIRLSALRGMTLQEKAAELLKISDHEVARELLH